MIGDGRSEWYRPAPQPFSVTVGDARPMGESGLLLIRMGESGTKSVPVRRRWEQMLSRNLEEIFVRGGRECVVRNDRGHLYVQTDDVEAAIPLIKHAFGVTSFSPVVEVESDLDLIGDAAVTIARGLIKENESFAIRARRTGTHDFTSQDVGRIIGSAVFTGIVDRNPRVDLTNPDREIAVEVREKRTYLSATRIPGPGGLPYGCEGRVVGLLRDWQWAVASWLVMKRGCRLIPVAWGPDGEAAAKVLAAWSGKTRVFHTDATDTAGAVADATALAGKRRGDAIVTGLRWEDLAKEQLKGTIPLFYPLTGYKPDEIRELGRSIGFTDI